MTITVMTILTLGVMPLVKLSVKRQKEQQLARCAAADAHRDRRVSSRYGGDDLHWKVTGWLGGSQAASLLGYVDPRSRVVISDCTIFGVDNPDRYPPDLETLVNGVNVIAARRQHGRAR